MPNSEATYTFGKIVWFDPSGQGTESSSPALTVANIKCGDGICEGNENSDTCVQDCPKPAPPPPPDAAQTPAPITAPITTQKPSGFSSTSMAWIVVAIIVAVSVIGYIIWQKKKGQ